MHQKGNLQEKFNITISKPIRKSTANFSRQIFTEKQLTNLPILPTKGSSFKAKSTDRVFIITPIISPAPETSPIPSPTAKCTSTMQMETHTRETSKTANFMARACIDIVMVRFMREAFTIIARQGIVR